MVCDNGLGGMIMLSNNISNEEATNLIDVLKNNHNRKADAAKTEVLLKNYGLGYSARHLRSVVEYIRKNDLASPSYLVSSTTNGYWLTNDVSEMKAFLNQELERVSNQYGNIQPLHQRLIHKKRNTHVKQLSVFNQ